MSKGDVVERWLHGLVDTFADYQPDKTEVHLPFGQKMDVYNLYMQEVFAGCEGLVEVSFSFFRRIWSDRLAHLKVRAFHRYITFCKVVVHYLFEFFEVVCLVGDLKQICSSIDHLCKFYNFTNGSFYKMSDLLSAKSAWKSQKCWARQNLKMTKKFGEKPKKDTSNM